MYTPQLLPSKKEDMDAFLSDEFNRIAASYNDLQDGIVGVDHSIPPRVKPGMLKIFDGSDADPLGSGKAGVYYFGEDNQWHFLTDSQSVIDAVEPMLDSFGLALTESITTEVETYVVGALGALQSQLDASQAQIVNSDGICFQFANGLQVCTGAITGMAATNPVAGLFRSAAATSVTFPAAFRAGTIPDCGGSDAASAFVFASARGSVTNIQIIIWATASLTGRAVRWHAIGLKP